MRALILICVLLVMFVAVVQAASPGIATAMSAPAMNQIVDRMLPGILAQIKSAPIDNMSGKESGFKYEVRDIQMRRLDIGAFTMAAQPDGLALSLKNLDVSLGLHWKYKKSGFPYVPFGRYAHTAICLIHPGSPALTHIHSLTPQFICSHPAALLTSTLTTATSAASSSCRRCRPPRASSPI